MGAEVKPYLQEHAIPQLFEGLITGLIYHKPDDPIEFLEHALSKVRQNPSFEYKWDSFVDEQMCRKYEESVKPDLKVAPAEKQKKRAKSKNLTSAVKQSARGNSKKSAASSTVATRSKLLPRQTLTVMQAAETAAIPDVPIILFMGGPGGGKTRHAARVQEALSKFGLVHVCMPDIIRAAIAKYQNSDSEWKEAAERYYRGELIPNNLALGLVKAEMSKHQDAKAFFLEGFPREARQVENFEREVKPVNMAMILDYDEGTLREHMESRGLDTEVIDAKIREFKLKTLPSAKYFDDQRLLHLIPGEQTDQWIFERMKLLIQRAMELGVPITTSKVASRVGSPMQQPDAVTTVSQAAAIVEAATVMVSGKNELRPATKVEIKDSCQKKDSKPSGAGTELTPDMSVPESQLATKDEPDIRTSESEKPKEEAESVATESKMSVKEKPSTQQSSNKRNMIKESKSEKPRIDSIIETQPIADIEIREKSQISKATSEVIKRPIPVLPIPKKETSEVERLSESSKQSNRSNTKPKLNRTISQTSRSRETSIQSVCSMKSETQSVLSVKNETQIASEPSPNPKSDASTANDRFPRGVPNNAPVVIVVGPPGSNKAETSKRIAKKYDGFTHVSMGDLLRKEVQSNIDDQLWQRIGKKINAGEPVPTKICRELLYAKIYEDDVSSGYVIEGYPRAKNQAVDLENQFGHLHLVVLIDCTEEFCIETIEKRKKELGEEVRPDDCSEAVNVRLQMFKENTLPMLKYFDDKGELKVVDGDSSLEKIFEKITEEIDSNIFIKERESKKKLPVSEEPQKKTVEQQ
uniref:Adenylate kinase n=1 Tax=Setaria digitata TaxID=48799 RepID=A0A915Q090_9BILA